MKITVDITDFGTDLSKSTHWKNFKGAALEFLEKKKFSYGLNGKSVESEISKLETSFYIDVRRFVTTCAFDTTTDKRLRSKPLSSIALDATPNGKKFLTGHRYRPILEASCDALSNGFKSSPQGYGKITAEFEIKTKMDMENMAQDLSDKISDIFTSPNRTEIKNAFKNILDSLVIQAGVRVTANACPEQEEFVTPEWGVSHTNANVWAQKASEAGAEAAKEKWVNVVTTVPIIEAFQE